MLNVVIFVVCGNRATHLISSLNNISRLSRHNVFVCKACHMNHCVSVERLVDLMAAALCVWTESPFHSSNNVAAEHNKFVLKKLKLHALIQANWLT